MDNTGEVIAMGMVAVIQFGLVIASLYDQKFVIFKTTESLMMLIINGVQTYVAFRINSRSLVRTIARRVCDRLTSRFRRTPPRAGADLSGVRLVESAGLR